MAGSCVRGAGRGLRHHVEMVCWICCTLGQHGNKSLNDVRPLWYKVGSPGPRGCSFERSPLAVAALSGRDGHWRNGHDQSGTPETEVRHMTIKGGAP